MMHVEYILNLAQKNTYKQNLYAKFVHALQLKYFHCRFRKSLSPHKMKICILRNKQKGNFIKWINPHRAIDTYLM